MFKIKGVLFDLDGTLVDTAVDLAYALNQVLIENQQSALPFERIRPMVSLGGAALIKLGFAKLEQQFDMEKLRRRFVEIYRENISTHSQLFPELENCLDELEQKNIPWGIVTNKPGWLSEPLLQQLQLDKRCQSLVCGDTLKVKKPHPEPLFYACSEIAQKPQECVYIGDAKRDIEAGNAAKMMTIIAEYGYIEPGEDVQLWQADKIFSSPGQLKEFLVNNT